MSKITKAEKAQMQPIAIAWLRELHNDGGVFYFHAIDAMNPSTVKVLVLRGGQVLTNVSHTVAKATGQRYSRRYNAITINGGGFSPCDWAYDLMALALLPENPQALRFGVCN